MSYSELSSCPQGFFFIVNIDIASDLQLRVICVYASYDYLICHILPDLFLSFFIYLFCFGAPGSQRSSLVLPTPPIVSLVTPHFLETGSCYVPQAGLKFMILLSS